MVSFSETLCVMLQKETHTHTQETQHVHNKGPSVLLAGVHIDAVVSALSVFLIHHLPSLLTLISSFPPIVLFFNPILNPPSSHLHSPPHPSSPPLSEACWEMCQCIRACSSSGSSNSMALYPNMDWGEAGRGVTAVNSVRKGQRTALGPDTVMRRWDKTTFKIKIH